jgi:hypothetical protein
MRRNQQCFITNTAITKGVFCGTLQPIFFIVGIPRNLKKTTRRFCIIVYNSSSSIDSDGLRKRGEEVDRKRKEWILQRRKLRTCIEEDKWNELIWSFEQRAKAAGQSDFFQATPDNGDYSAVEEAQLGKRASPPLSSAPPIVETGLCVAAVRTLLFISRIARWKDFFSVAGPIPIVYIALRWGPRYSRLALCLLFCFFLVRPGPLYCLQYMLTQGLATGVLCHVLWWQWNWVVCILCSACAYLLGLVLEISFTCFLFGKNTWNVITKQSVQLFLSLFPSIRHSMEANTSGSLASYHFWVQVAVLLFLFIHSLIHVVSVYIPCCLFLSAIAGRMNLLARKPSLLPGMQKLIDQLDSSSSSSRFPQHRNGE